MLRALIRLLIGPAPKTRKTQRVQTPRHAQPHVPPRRSTDEQAPIAKPTTDVLKGKCYVIDGDTIVISGTKIRIAGIDAPELEHPWGKKAKFALIGLCKGKVVKAVLQEDVSYDRIVAKCFLPDGRDLAAELVKQGLALDWPKFSGGEYREYEPHDARKRLWRAAARQKGRLKLSDS